MGRNESGKTNVLLALRSLNPPEGMEDLTYVKDFPRDRNRTEFSEGLTVVTTEWALSDPEKNQLSKLWPNAHGVETVQISRPYKAIREFNLINATEVSVDRAIMLLCLKKVRQSVTPSLRSIVEAEAEKLSAKMEEFIEKISQFDQTPLHWAEMAIQSVSAFESDFVSSSHPIPEVAVAQLDVVREYAQLLVAEGKKRENAIEWLDSIVPVFVYLDEYPEFRGHQNIPELLKRQEKNTLRASDINFLKLARVAELDPVELNKLLPEDHEQRQLLANRAGSTVTKKIRELWTDRKLEIRFNLDGQHFDTLVSDSTATYPVEVNLDERSRGFKWFFSFHMTFAADTSDGPMEDAILLLDEPGLHLHAVAQKDLLGYFSTDIRNQIVFTTHSPFMIPVDDLPAVRTVNISQETGTTISNDPVGDDKTLFPLQTALGYDLTQTLFLGDKDLVIEGVTDFWYLSSVSEYINDTEGKGLQKGLILTPAGGATKIAYMVALLVSQNVKVLALLDDEPQGRHAATEIIKNKLLREENLVFVTRAFQGSSRKEADIEDLIDPAIYENLVQLTYQAELKGQDLPLNKNIPRIVKRYEKAFGAIGVEFHKSRPAKRFLILMGENPASVLNKKTLERFKRLFKVLNDRIAALQSSDHPPFQ